MFRLLFLALVLAGWAAPAHAQSCESPQDAARTLLDWLQPERWEPDVAAGCLDLAPEQEDGDPGAIAVRLKRVLDARGIYVPTDDLSLDPDFVDKDGQHRVTPVTTFPLLTITRKGDRWLIGRALVERTDQLYDDTFSGISGRIQHLIPPALDVKILGVHTWQAVYFVLLVALSWLAGWLAQLMLRDQILRFASRFKVALTAHVVRRTRGPLTWFAVSVVFITGIADLQLSVRATQGLLFIANTLLSVAVVLIAVRLVDLGADFFGKRAEATATKLDDQVIPLISRAMKFGLWVLGVVFVVQNMGTDVGSLLTGLGIGGLAFALAAKDTIENLFGSLTIFIDRPFQIGDWVIIGGNIEGVVEEVGFRCTRIRTFTSSVISVPNGKVAQTTINNMGQRKFRRVKATLGLRYDTPRAKLEAYVAAIRAHLEENPAVWNGTREVHFAAFGDSALQIMIYFFLDVPDWSVELRERSACYVEFIRLAEEIGVQFAFPSQSIYVEGTGGQQSVSATWLAQ